MTGPHPVEEPFDLRTLIREVAIHSDAADPKILAKEILTRIPDRHLHEALAVTLPDYVRVALHRGRPIPFPDEEDQPDGQATSWKLRGARAYGRLLRQAVDVNGDGTGWKYLADCTLDDLTRVATLRRRQAEDLLATAGWYEKVARLLAEYDAATVSALPETVLTALVEES